jgi:hypothetical protein
MSRVPPADLARAQESVASSGRSHLQVRADDDSIIVYSLDGGDPIWHARLWAEEEELEGEYTLILYGRKAPDWSIRGTIDEALEALFTTFSVVLEPSPPAPRKPPARPRLRIPSGFEKSLGALARLGDAPATITRLRALAAEVGWKERSASGGRACEIDVDEGMRLFAQSDARGRATAAWLPLYFWEEWDEEDYESDTAYRRARRRFDALFEKALERARTVMGKPEPREEPPPGGYLHAVWRRSHGFWLLHQCERDIQFGVELGLWFAPARPGAPAPRLPVV